MSDGKITIPHNWNPRDYQIPMWTFFQNGGKRGVCVWHRRAGKDLCAINLCSWFANQYRGLYWHLFPTYNQGRKIAWDGFTKDGRSFIDAFPPQLRESINNTEMKITLKNGSIYQVVGTDDPDRLVGANPIGCVFSEYSLQDPKAWDIIRPILAENGGWALFIYTARGKNHGYTLLNMARRNSPKWFSEVLTVADTGAVSLEAVQDERDAGMPPELVEQEFFCSFEAPIVGAYYSSQMSKMMEDGRICKIPWEPKLDVYTAWDLGMDDHTCIGFFQLVSMEVRWIDYYENSGEGLAHYAKILKEKPYAYNGHYFPHDVNVRELGSGKSRVETLRSLGIRAKTVQKHELEDGIEATRNFLSRCWFEEDKCARVVEALKQYRKEYDEKLHISKSTPLHDWTSHPADMVRMAAYGLRESTGKKKERPTHAETEYDVLRC